ncbi:sugar phosphate nucleotidyltransferase [Succinivibrio dextrinosolvens]|uniref:sugar phosphate nucleotidyltransferase n=1 Tax=Succinivibrio dextrinosolvens TaxID=83771 RepID=UPI001922B708|nr:sugar phosphate nucleotidyltransferase [Succinivibrio dextrinosolvens]
MNSTLSLVDFIVNDTSSLSEAMQKIDRNTHGIVFISDKNGLLIASLTDGDVRRYLLSGGEMNCSAITAANKNPKSTTSLKDAKNLFHKRDFVVIPIVDKKGKIVDLYTGDIKEQKQFRPQLNVPVVINAGGKGSRLYPLTKVLPKPLIPVGDLPIIELIMKSYLYNGCDDFHIIVNYKKELIKTYFKENETQYNICWYDELVPLGTGGGLSLLKNKVNDTFFFANCDVLLDSNYADILKFHKENRNVITMVCAYKNFNIPYGVVEIGKDGIIQEMKEKPLISYLTNTGIYVVEPSVLDDIKDNVPIGFPDIIEYERRIGRKTAVYPVRGNDWMDMGQFPELEKMRHQLLGE